MNEQAVLTLPRASDQIVAAHPAPPRTPTMPDTSPPQTAYGELESRFKRLNLVRQSAGVLQWDLETLMPPGGAAARTEQLAALKVIAHQLLTDRALGDLIKKAEGQRDLDEWQKANLREMTREWRHATCLPEAL